MGIKISLPIIVRVDNMGDFFMTLNGPGKVSKHVDIHYHFIQHYIKDGVIKIVLLPLKKKKKMDLQRIIRDISMRIIMEFLCIGESTRHKNTVGCSIICCICRDGIYCLLLLLCVLYWRRTRFPKYRIQDPRKYIKIRVSILRYISLHEV